MDPSDLIDHMNKQGLTQHNLDEAIKIQREAMIIAQKKNFEALSKRCFNICVAYPREELLRGQQSCVTNCFDRMIEAQSIIGQRMMEKIPENERVHQMDLSQLS